MNAAGAEPQPSRLLSFEAWMEQALHGNEGYYTARVRGIGRRGDFATSASASSALGEAVASWLDQELRIWPEVRTVIEVGGGGGSLSHTALHATGWWKRQRLKWYMVETSPTLRAQQQARLGPRAQWFDTLPAAMRSCQGKALLFHNELVDAFPVRLLQWSASRHAWDEVWLEQVPGGWVERLVPTEIALAEQRMHRALSPDHWANTPLRDGQRVELPAAYCRWLDSWAPAWRLGSMLTVDYGDAFPNLYYRRPRGTVRAYIRHQTLTGVEIYRYMGQQDVTADVNFTDIATCGATHGWEAEPLLTQRDFLFRYLPSFLQRLENDASLAYLADEAGAGAAFKVLRHRCSLGRN